jgi:hypothetical protein
MGDTPDLTEINGSGGIRGGVIEYISELQDCESTVHFIKQIPSSSIA